MPAGMEPLWPELAELVLQPVEVTVLLPGGRVAMQIVVAEADAENAFGMALRACRGMDEFKIQVEKARRGIPSSGGLPRCSDSTPEP